MVVHDMRNPTNQIEFTLNESISQLKKLKSNMKHLDNCMKNLEKDPPE